ncbi:MBL fold metallo-hydrolase [Candidatus Pacearchaeota archaeon]|nr:MBL fold metallo-hydrolase [Candidatus Pacearchaeota archaeon]
MLYKNVEIQGGRNSGFLINASGIKIYIDPFQINGNEKADLILITHGHYDHFSIEDIKKIIKIGTKIIGPAELLSQVRRLRDRIDFEIGEVGKKIEFNGIGIECVASYNINKHFHPKEEGYLGYVMDLFGVKVYHAGDSDFIPEMINIVADIILLPVGGKFAMNSEEALKAVDVIKPNFAIPMHWGSVAGTLADAERFVNGCRELGVDSRVLEKEI